MDECLRRGGIGLIISRRRAKSRETVRAQPVDATPSNQLIRQYFLREPIYDAVVNQNLNSAVFRSHQRP